MDAVQDLGRNEPWQASLERSLARRAASNRRRERRRKARRFRLLGICAAAIFLIAVLTTALGGRSTQASATAAPAHRVAAHRVFAKSDTAGPGSRLMVPGTDAAGRAKNCQPASVPMTYVNPLASARVTPERIDQGVDYAGSGTLAAIGAATVTSVGSAGTGWPGTFIEYRLLDGPDAGCYVYYAEGVEPATGLHAGESVAAGQPVATIIPGWSTGIELGWAAGTSTTTYAEKMHQWNPANDEGNVASPAGKSFSALIASLGGPPGKDEG